MKVIVYNEPGTKFECARNKHRHQIRYQLLFMLNKVDTINGVELMISVHFWCSQHLDIGGQTSQQIVVTYVYKCMCT